MIFILPQLFQVVTGNVMGKKKRVVEDPNVFEQDFGPIKVRLHLKVPQGLHATSGAMDQLFEAEISCQRRKENDGTDNYILAVDKALAALDSFIQETRTGAAGWKDVYDSSKAGDWTLLLLWQIRNVIQHHGGLINAKCKGKYEQIYREMDQAGIKPMIDLPEKVKSGQGLTFGFDDFKMVRKCLFEFIERDIGKKDTDILRTRSSHGDYDLSEINFVFTVDSLPYSLNIKGSSEFGLSFNEERDELIIPAHIRYSPSLKSFVNYRTGETLQLKPLPSDYQESPQYKGQLFLPKKRKK